MGRAKPKIRYSLFPPVIDSPKLPQKGFELLLEDLNIRYGSPRAAAFQADLIQEIRSFRSWTGHDKELPKIREQVAELKQLQPHLQASLDALLTLSPLARNRFTHAYADAGFLSPSRIQELDRLIDGAIGDLAVIVQALKQTTMNWAKGPRGRPSNPVHILIGRLVTMFVRHDADKHDDDAARQSACDAFVRHALLKAFKISPPKRLDIRLSE